MRGWTHTVLVIVALVSLVLCLGTTALWMRSTSKMDQLRTADPYRQTTLVSDNGEFCVETVTMAVPEFEPGFGIAHALPSQYGPRAVNWQIAGVGAGEQTVPSLAGPIRYNTYMIPLWLVVVLLGAGPVLMWDGRRNGVARESDAESSRPTHGG